MEIKLYNLEIGNFKGIKQFGLCIDGENAVIKGANGTGKTTVYDAFLWLLFGKDSTGRKDFELRPLDAHNQPIKGLVLSVEAEIDVDGTRHVFKKEHHEKVIKSQLRGYETLCWIDEVPKKVGEYSEYITSIIPEDFFKLLTDLYHFNGKMHWTDRRAVLLDIAGEIGTPKGFDELLATLNGRELDEYKKVLAEQKKRLVKERDEINPRIDELQRGLDEYVGTDGNDVDMLKTNREHIQGEIAELNEQRNTLFAQEQGRQEKIARLNELRGDKSAREIRLKQDTGGIEALLEEKAEIEKDVAEKIARKALVVSTIQMGTANIESKKSEIETHSRSLEAVRGEYKDLQGEPIKDTCKLCGQKLPAERASELEEQRKAALQAVTLKGNEQMGRVKVCKAETEALEAKCKALNDKFETAHSEYLKAFDHAAKRIPEIEDAIKLRPTTPPEKDPQWLAICEQIEKAEREIGEPAAQQLEALDTARTEKNDELAKINNSLAQSDRRAQDNKRIGELEQMEKEIAQQIANTEKLLNDIGEYKAAESSMIESAVNGKFKYIKFKLFNMLFNGSLEDCCEAILVGVPYNDMSGGQKIFAGIDIGNVLSTHYGLSVPLFVDNAESFTLPLESTSQTVELYAQKSAKKLVVELKGEMAHA